MGKLTKARLDYDEIPAPQAKILRSNVTLGGGESYQGLAEYEEPLKLSAFTPKEQASLVIAVMKQEKDESHCIAWIGGKIDKLNEVALDVAESYSVKWVDDIQADEKQQEEGSIPWFAYRLWRSCGVAHAYYKLMKDLPAGKNCYGWQCVVHTVKAVEAHHALILRQIEHSYVVGQRVAGQSKGRDWPTIVRDWRKELPEHKSARACSLAFAERLGVSLSTVEKQVKKAVKASE